MTSAQANSQTDSRADTWKKTPLSWGLVVIAGFCLVAGIFFLRSAHLQKSGVQPAALEKLLRGDASLAEIPDSRVEILEVTSPGGLNAWLVEDTSVPVIALNFSFPGGMMLESEDQAGYMMMLAAMLDEGAGPYDSQAFQRELENNVISLSFSAGRDRFYGSVRTLSRHQDKAFELLHLALTQPHFEEESLERMRRATVNNIRHSLGNPGWVAARVFNGMLFQGHVYERPGRGNLETVAKITADDLKTLARRQFIRDGLQISVSGDISAEDLAAKLDDIFGGLHKGGEEDIPETPALNAEAAGKVYVYEMDVPQSVIRFAHQGISVHDEDYPAAVVLNYILGGGGFASRLMKALREEHGLTYGIYTGLAHMRQANLLQGQFSTANETAGEAVALVKDTWRHMAEKGPTAQEVEEAKNYLIGSFPLSLTSTGGIASILSGLQEDGRDTEYINSRNDRLRAVDKDDVRRVAARLLNADELGFTVIGRPDGLDDGVVPVTKLPGM
ncbi:MAG: insulinase family protein [Micavibrio sp.]|nr:MAG: insulinase family protein [Micavibrio sp.]